MVTLKDRRNDKLVSVLINGKWETRMFDDVCKIIMKTTEDYFNPLFIELQDKYYIYNTTHGMELQRNKEIGIKYRV